MRVFLTPSPIVRLAVLLHNDETSSAMTLSFSVQKVFLISDAFPSGVLHFFG